MKIGPLGFAILGIIALVLFGPILWGNAERVEREVIYEFTLPVGVNHTVIPGTPGSIMTSGTVGMPKTQWDNFGLEWYIQTELIEKGKTLRFHYSLKNGSGGYDPAIVSDYEVGRGYTIAIYPGYDFRLVVDESNNWSVFTSTYTATPSATSTFTETVTPYYTPTEGFETQLWKAGYQYAMTERSMTLTAAAPSPVVVPISATPGSQTVVQISATPGGP